MRLPCSSKGITWTYRFWRSGQLELFTQYYGKDIIRKTNRGDMDIDKGTFTLTIGKTQIEDGNLMTCMMREAIGNGKAVDYRIIIYSELLSGCSVTLSF